MDARTREGEVSATHTDVSRIDLPIKRTASDAPLAVLKRGRKLENDPNARALAEREQRTRWLRELRDLIVAAELPIVHLASSARDPESLLGSVGQGRRAKTIRGRVLDWKRQARFYMTVGGPGLAPFYH